MTVLTDQTHCDTVRRWGDLRLAFYMATIARVWPNRPICTAAAAEAARRLAAPKPR